MAFRAAAYTRFQGPYSRMPAWWPLWRATLRRGWSSKWIRNLTYGAAGMALAVTLVLYSLQSVMPEWRALLEDLGRRAGGAGGREFRFDGRVYLSILHWFIYPFLLPMAALLGYDLMAGDLRGNALESYFSRPLTPRGYLLGRTAAFCSYLLLATLVPVLWIWAADVLTAPAGHWAQVRSVPLGVAATMGLVAASMALFVQALVTVTRSGLWTALVFVVLFVSGSAASQALYELTGRPAFLGLAVWQIIFTVANACLGFPEERAGHPPLWLALAVLLGTALLSLLYLLWRLQKRALVG